MDGHPPRSPEIYTRSWYAFDDWQPEHRVTDEAFACRRPSIESEECCGDLLIPAWMVTFEVESPGATESYAATFSGDVSRFSPMDGLPSVRPNIGGLTFYAPWPASVAPHYVATWTDVPLTSPRLHGLIDFQSAETDTLSEAGLSHALVAASEGSPRAPVLTLWVEERDGAPSLVACAGTLPGVLAVPDPAGAAIQLTAYPNPCREHVTLRLEGSAPSRASIRIVDAAGRLVRDFPAAVGGNPGPAVVWDLRDNRGRPVGMGTYFAVAETAGVRMRRILVVIR